MNDAVVKFICEKHSSDGIEFVCEKYGSNPFYDKWKRGRPTNEAKYKRELFHKWNSTHIKLYPELYPSFTLFLNRNINNDITVVNANGEKRVQIRYTQRNTQ